MNTVEQHHFDFFRTHPDIRPFLADDEAPPSENGLISYFVGTETAPSPEVEAEMEAQKQHVLDLASVANAYVRKQANAGNNPDLVFDPTLWLTAYNHLPLMGPANFQTSTITRSLKGLTISKEFLKVLLGFATSGGASFAGFAQYLGGLGGDIRAALTKNSQGYRSTTVAAVIETDAVGTKVGVNSYLKLFSVDFSVADTKLTTVCGTVESYNLNLTYRSAISLFNSGALKNPKVKNDFDKFISTVQGTDITDAKNFFGGDFPKDA